MGSSIARIKVSGKFFRTNAEKWYARGFCYGPFAPNHAGEFLPEPYQVAADFRQMRSLGATCLRTYIPPPEWLLETALQNDLRVFVDVPWEKHRCFLEDWTAQQEARRTVTEVARRLGGSAALFAISVANEIPGDIVRFYGADRVAAFVDELLDRAHQAAPECLATYANYPTTEFLQPTQQDFCCFNVYLHDADAYGRYLDRLQHLAGAAPLVIGEYGVDSYKHGEVEQGRQLEALARLTHAHGAAGGFVFAYTDDWFTGGHQIDKWAFGVTTARREAKCAAGRMQRVWNEPSGSDAVEGDLPKVSVVVCSYNGARTLDECLQSLMRLNYPDYEVLLIDDGSQDDTEKIASRYPQVNYIHQRNRGLSVARNVGMRLAVGEIVAYTDSDCVVDEDWLTYLVDAMHRQKVDGIGGPNLTPLDDNWTAQCVAASPGNPSHVMFDDRLAEHLPGCNMAFGRTALMSIGGFDPQFRQAGDDVDLCWRLLAAGRRLGYAAGAMVWHHRRCTVRAYYQQQKGYGRAEAMLAFKHPQRFLATGFPKFEGVIYGDGVAGLPLLPAKVYHGRFGSASYQTIYQPREFRADARATTLEWHFLNVVFLMFSALVPPLLLMSGAMSLLTVRSVMATVHQASKNRRYSYRSRLLISWLHLVQPVVRGLHRNGYTLRHKRLPRVSAETAEKRTDHRRISASAGEYFWLTTNSRGRAELLDAIVSHAKAEGWPGDFYGGWSAWDIELMADLWHHVSIRTATEELGWPKRFTRARWTVHSTRLARAAVAAVAGWCGLALATGAAWALLAALLPAAALLTTIVQSRRRCLRAVGDLVRRAATLSELASLDDGDQENRPVTKSAPKLRRPKAALANVPRQPATPKSAGASTLRVRPTSPRSET